MKFAYLAAILFSTFGMGVLDKRFGLALFHDARRTIITIAIGVAVFIAWDVLGITMGIFFSGNSPYTTGLYLAPEFPVEELFFLTFLCYFTLITYRLLERRWPRT